MTDKELMMHEIAAAEAWGRPVKELETLRAEAAAFIEPRKVARRARVTAARVTAARAKRESR